MPKPDPAVEAARNIIYQWDGRMGHVNPELLADNIRPYYAPLLAAADEMAKALNALSRDAEIKGIACKRIGLLDNAWIALAAYRQLRPEEDGDG